MKKKNIKDLLNKFICDKLSREELDFIYQSVNHNMHEDEIKAWFYHYWDESSMKTNKLHSSDVLKKIKESIRLTTPSTDKNPFSDNKLHAKKKKIFAIVFRYAAIFLTGFLLASFLIHQFNYKAIPDKISYNELTTPRGSKSSITLTDGTQVWLNAGSTIKYPDRFGTDQREIFLEGEAFFDVKRDESRPFFVKTNEIYIKVLGTQFNVKSYPEENTIETTLVTGSIEIEAKKAGTIQKQCLKLKPNQKATFSKSSHKLSLLEEKIPGRIKSARVEEVKISDKINTEIITSWKDDKLVFSKERFEDILVKMERWYDVEIILNDENLKDYKYTGAFEKETLEQALNALKMATPFEYSVDKNYIIIYSRN